MLKGAKNRQQQARDQKRADHKPAGISGGADHHGADLRQIFRHSTRKNRAAGVFTGVAERGR